MGKPNLTTLEHLRLLGLRSVATTDEKILELTEAFSETIESMEPVISDDEITALAASIQ